MRRDWDLARGVAIEDPIHAKRSIRTFHLSVADRLQTTSLLTLSHPNHVH